MPSRWPGDGRRGHPRRPRWSQPQRGLVELDLAFSTDLVGDLLPASRDVIGDLLGGRSASEAPDQLVLGTRVVLEDARDARLVGGVRVVVAVGVGREVVVDVFLVI